MTDQEARQLLTEALAEIAPEVDLDGIDQDANLQRAADLDSMDMLSLIETVARSARIDIPEDDIGRLSTVESFVAYLHERAAGQ
ncbi:MULTISPECIES: acyl carrier protein [Pseudofrankia]|uniref:acyl carrier protein n=1 Tax=Pseudofrankia TaxID=2994363 RepID=UPI000234C2D5|nr:MULTISPECIES: phosphopantetheine-binding protein [Pseudofrankia]OHV29623.1 hypothetical protein BCD49_06685 [Pseudofrankia sp. EUN1h]